MFLFGSRKRPSCRQIDDRRSPSRMRKTLEKERKEADTNGLPTENRAPITHFMWYELFVFGQPMNLANVNGEGDSPLEQGKVCSFANPLLIPIQKI